MGEAKRKLSATNKFLMKFPTCYFCGGKRAATTREHMPPKSLFDNSHRPNKLVMPACAECNRSTSTADLTAAIMPEYGTLVQGQWNERETFEYRHAVNVKDGLFACLAKLRRGLFVAGFAATDANFLPSEIDWLHPDDPQTLLELPRFQEKL
jgi:hypothetical protein